MNKFKENIRYLRTSEKLTQKDLAKALNVAPQTYASYEQGRREPDIDTLIKIARFYNVSLDFLVGIE